MRSPSCLLASNPDSEPEYSGISPSLHYDFQELSRSLFASARKLDSFRQLREMQSSAYLFQEGWFRRRTASRSSASPCPQRLSNPKCLPSPQSSTALDFPAWPVLDRRRIYASDSDWPLQRRTPHCNHERTPDPQASSQS